MIEEEMIKKRVKIFFDIGTPAHIILKDNSWLNGYVAEISSDFFIFLGRVQGKMPVFFMDVIKFEFFTGDINSLKKLGDRNGINNS